MNEPQIQSYGFGEFRINGSKRLLLKDNGEDIPLTPKVFDLLFYLVQNSGKIIEKDELMTAIWTDTIVEESNLSQNISILRRVLGEKRGEHRFIATVPGRGYKFVEKVYETIEDEKKGREELEEKSLTLSPNEASNEFNPRNLDISVDDFQIKDRKFEIENEIRNPKFAIQNPKWLVISIVLGVLVLSATGFLLWRKNGKSGGASIKTIAVLPFKPLVEGHRDEVLEVGMADTLISRLSNNREIVVRPLSSARKYGSLEQDSLAAGRELGVDSVLDGNIQRWGDKIRVNVRMIKTSDGTTLWAGTFDEKFTDIFAVQDAISNKVAQALALRWSSKDKTHLTKRYSSNIEAYGLYLKGRYHAAKLTPADTEKGISYFQQAIEIDPNYTLAYVDLADAYRSLPLTSEKISSEFMPKAKAAAERAIEIDPTFAEAHAVLGWIIFWYDWDWQKAESNFKRALELDPNSANAHIYYAHLLSNTGRHTESLAEAKRAGELDPLNLRTVTLQAQFLLHAGQTDEALANVQKIFELDPNFWMARALASSAYIEKKMYSEAIDEALKAKQYSGSIHPVSLAAYAFVKSGKPAEARSLLNETLELSAKQYVSPQNIALIYNSLNETDETIAWLERGFQDRDPKMTFLKVDPKWNNLHSEPRFIDLMRRMNFK